jgi:hypothetical protein
VWVSDQVREPRARRARRIASVASLQGSDWSQTIQQRIQFAEIARARSLRPLMSGYRVCGVGAPRKLDSANCRGAIRRRWAARRYGLDLQLALYVCYELH